MKIPAHVYAFGLAALCLIGAIVLVAINKSVPVELWQAAFLSLGAGAGISVPTTTPAASVPG